MPAILTSYMEARVQNVFTAQLSAYVPVKAADTGPDIWTPATHVGRLGCRPKVLALVWTKPTHVGRLRHTSKVLALASPKPTHVGRLRCKPKRLALAWTKPRLVAIWEMSQ